MGEKDPERKKKLLRVLEGVTYLAPFLLPEDGRWGVSFGLTLERHIFSRSCCLVLGLSHKLGWDWEGEKNKGAGTQSTAGLTEPSLAHLFGFIFSLPPEISCDLSTPPVLPFLPILLHPPHITPANCPRGNPHREH